MKTRMYPWKSNSWPFTKQEHEIAKGEHDCED